MHEIAKSVLPGELVFDVGANRGNKSDWFSRRGVRVIAVEPQPRLVEELRIRFDQNQLVHVVPMGLSDQPGMLTMTLAAESVLSTFSSSWRQGRFRDARWTGQIDVEVTTLDFLITRFGLPRYLKIDVEGFEKQVISGLSKKVGCLSFEFTSEYIHVAASICEQLFEKGFFYFNFSVGESDVFEFNECWVTFDVLLSRLREMISRDASLWGDIYAA